MSERTRDFLKQEFRDGERPSGADFADLIDSFVNKQTDGISIDGDRTLVLSRGLRLGDSSANVTGGLRFNNNQLQVFTGGAWVDVAAGGGGAFEPPPADAIATAVAHNGNVGIGPFGIGTAPAAPTFRLEVLLGANAGTGDQVRFGNAVIANGQAALGGFANFSHFNHASNTNYAIRQAPNGAVHINAVAGQIVSIRQGGTAVRFGVSTAGNVIVNGETDLPGAPGGSTLQVQGNSHLAGNLNVAGDLNITGQAVKPGGGAWSAPSDARIKTDVRDLELGLSELQQVRTVRFRYNGRAGTQAGQAGVGVLAQEIETSFPEMVRRISVADDPGLDDMRIFDPSALTYVLINAVKELAARVEHLEQALAAATAAARPGPVVA